MSTRNLKRELANLYKYYEPTKGGCPPRTRASGFTAGARQKIERRPRPPTQTIRQQRANPPRHAAAKVPKGPRGMPRGGTPWTRFIKANYKDIQYGMMCKSGDYSKLPPKEAVMRKVQRAYIKSKKEAGIY